jgi:hypothetical protein
MKHQLEKVVDGSKDDSAEQTLCSCRNSIMINVYLVGEYKRVFLYTY